MILDTVTFLIVLTFVLQSIFLAKLAQLKSVPSTIFRSNAIIGNEDIFMLASVKSQSVISERAKLVDIKFGFIKSPYIESYKILDNINAV